MLISIFLHKVELWLKLIVPIQTFFLLHIFSHRIDLQMVLMSISVFQYSFGNLTRLCTFSANLTWLYTFLKIVNSPQPPPWREGYLVPSERYPAITIKWSPPLHRNEANKNKLYEIYFKEINSEEINQEENM